MEKNDTQTPVFTAPTTPLVIGDYTLSPDDKPKAAEIKQLAKGLKTAIDTEGNIDAMLGWAATAITARIHKGKKKVTVDDILYEEIDFADLTAHYTHAVQLAFNFNKLKTGGEGKPETAES